MPGRYRRSYLIHLTAQGNQDDAKQQPNSPCRRSLLKSRALAERKRLIVSLTRIADHWETHTALNADEERPRTARALHALDHLAAASDH